MHHLIGFYYKEHFSYRGHAPILLLQQHSCIYPSIHLCTHPTYSSIHPSITHLLALLPSPLVSTRP